MSKVNLFEAAQTVSAAPAAIAEPTKRDWRSEPIAVPGSGQKCKQFMALTRLLRSKDLMSLPVGPIRTLVANIAVFDDETGHWTELPKLTKGQAWDLCEELHKLPNVGFSKVATGTAEPVSEVAAEAPKAAPKAKAKSATKSKNLVEPSIGIHETETGLRVEIYRTASGQIRTRLV